MGLVPNNSLEDFRQTKTSVVITEVIVLMVEYVQTEWYLLHAEFGRWKKLSRGSNQPETLFSNGRIYG